VGLSWLSKAFASFDLGDRSSIELRDHAFEVVDGHPIASDSVRSGDSGIGKILASLVGSGATSGHFPLPRGDGNAVTKFVSYRQVGTYPLFVTVGLARRDYLQTWYRSALAAAAAAFAFLAASILLALLYLRGAQRSRSAARALEAQERKYRTIADYTYDWEFWIDENGAYYYVSPSCERITGYKPSEFYLDPVFFATTILPDDREIYRSHRHLSEPGDDFATLSFRIRRADGHIRWIEHLCRPVFSEEGAWLGTRGTNRDITERREAEERIKALLEEKDLILKEVHHRIKNNMAVVASLLDIQIDAEREGPVSQTLRIASNRVKSMAVLYDKLYRTEAGKSASLDEYLSTLLKEVHGSFPGHERIGLRLELEGIELDSEKLSSLGILLNELLTNSMKYAFAGRSGGSIEVKARRIGPRLQINYEDDGIGLSGARDESGSGFGMTLIAALAKQLGGVSTMGAEEGFSYALSFEV
jgi:PAS domain S-box-containing protein